MIIGARNSKLSLAYVARVKRVILEKNPEINQNQIEFKPIKTSGDIFHDKKLSEIGGKNLFCKEVEEKLLSKEIDIAVHSLKDMESFEKKNLLIGAYLKRNDCREGFISLKHKSLNDLKDGSIVGSSSRRRELQLKLMNKNILIKNIRGNIDTRINKLATENFDAIILAVAGVESLNLEKKIKKIFTTEEMLPAVGQGTVAVQCRTDDKITKNILKKINDHETELCALAEREMLKTIGGDCDTAIGGLAILENGKIRLKGQLFSDDGKKNFTSEVFGKKDEALKIGKIAGNELINLAGKFFRK
tara:strand:- start:407 stop:1315 length:909 start_codon:yes stop_codon:yes gene_type:complete